MVRNLQRSTTIARMKAELEEHFAKEERLIFPLMRSNHHPDKETLELISELEGEHVDVGDMIKEINSLQMLSGTG